MVWGARESEQAGHGSSGTAAHRVVHRGERAGVLCHNFFATSAALTPQTADDGPGDQVIRENTLGAVPH